MNKYLVLIHFNPNFNNFLLIFSSSSVLSIVVFAMYRLKALIIAESNRSLMEAEILSFIRINIPGLDYVKSHHLDQIADIEMVNILLAWKEWKEKRESTRQQFMMTADKFARDAEMKRHVQMVQQLSKNYRKSNANDDEGHNAECELLGACGESMHMSVADFKKQIYPIGRFIDDTFIITDGQKILDHCTDKKGLMELLDDFCLPQSGALVEDVVTAYDRQGGGYLLSALAAIVEKKPRLLLKMFDIESDPMQSIYAVKLYYNRSFHTVVVDDFFPFLPNKTEDIARKLWILLVKKAYAKLHGSYEATERGFESNVLADLTGGIPEIITGYLHISSYVIIVL